MAWIDAFGPAEAKYRAEIQHQTFGHLAPKPNVPYQGEMVFVQSEYGDYTLIRARFEGLDDSPWLFEDMTEFMCDKAKKEGVIYKFKGTYTVSKKDCMGRFKGTIEEVRL